jgi:hypothetical protein
MTTKEILDVLAKFATSIAVIFSAVALILNARAIRLQRRSLQANLFNDIKRRISELEDQHSKIEQSDLEKLEGWYYRMICAFESFAFYANRDFLDKDMVEFYATGIEHYIERLKKFPKLLAHFGKKRKEGPELCELAKYYLNVLKKPMPI